MQEVVGEFLPFAVALAVIPIPVIAVILMLFSQRPRSNGLAFLAGWVISVAAATGTLVALVDTSDAGESTGRSKAGAVLMLAIGAALVAMSIKQWRGRPTGDGNDPPAWMRTIEAFTAPKAFGLAVALAVLNPKNLLLMAGGAIAIAQADLIGTEQAIAVVVFTLVGSLSIAVPALAYVAMGERAQPMLDRAKEWLTQHSAAMMAVVLLLMGVVLVGKAVSSLGAS
jgi:threonine/homoserine/homoserine lactone efflux protein